MPELPELEVLRRNLAAQLTGEQILRVRPRSVAVLKTYDPPVEALAGRRVDGAGRRGKYLWLQAGDLSLVTHLSLGGRLVLGDKPAAARITLLCVDFAGGKVLSLTEAGTQRRAAAWVVADPMSLPGLSALGPEPLDADFTVDALAGILAGGGHTLKGMLTDQRAISGVGNAWSDDVLHRAGMSPFARPDRLDAEAVERLFDALVEVLTTATGALGEQARGEVTIPKAASRSFAVHARQGAACFVCGDTIRSVWMGERQTSYCPTCQTGGRELADRRRSRFLR